MKLDNRAIIPILLVGISAVALSAFLALLYMDRHVADLDGDPATHFPVLKDDSSGYVELAQELSSAHKFSSDGTAPETFRTPGYPLFIDIGELFGGITGVILLQILCLGGVAVLTFLIGERLWGRAVGLLSATIFAISPNALFHTVVVLSDIPFTFFILLSVYLLFFSRRTLAIVMLAAISLAIASYLRPIGLYLPVVLAMFLFYDEWKKKTMGNSIRTIGILIGIFAILIVPWLVRNRLETGAFAFSSVSVFNFAYYNVPAFLADRYGGSSSQYQNYENQINAYPASYLRTFPAVAKLDPIIGPALKGNIMHYALFHIESTSVFFLSSSVRYVIEQIEIPAVQNSFGLSAASPNLLSSLIHGRLGLIIETLRTQAAFTVDRALMIIVTVSALLAIFIRKNRFYSLLFLALIFYFALLTGPVSVPRYRLPVEPYLFLLAFSTLTYLWRRYRSVHIS